MTLGSSHLISQLCPVKGAARSSPLSEWHLLYCRFWGLGLGWSRVQLHFREMSCLIAAEFFVIVTL